MFIIITLLRLSRVIYVELVKVLNQANQLQFFVMADPQLRQVKDFLGVFNRISETCFNTCVNTFVDRTTTDEEIQCLDKCVTKYLGLNHKLMEVYVEIQPEIIQRRMNELSNINNQGSREETMNTNEVPVN